jgi:hypothetical protein
MIAKSLLLRVDFILGHGQPADRLIFHRWRRILVDALPRLLGCARRCPQAEHVCLHENQNGQGQGHYTAWLRIPTQRRPSRALVRRVEAQLHKKLAAGLEPLSGQVVKLAIRRRRAKAPALPARSDFLPLFPEAAPIPDHREPWHGAKIDADSEPTLAACS